MASSLEPKIIAYKAAAAMAAYVAVKKGATEDYVAICSAASDKVLGIVQNAPDAADALAEVCRDGGCKAKVGGSVVDGDLLTADASGFLVATTSNAEKVIAQAMEDGSSGDVIAVVMAPGIV